MAEAQPRFIASTPRSGLRPLMAGIHPVHTLHRQIATVLGERAGASLAGLFAEPHEGRTEIDWYSRLPGTPVGWNEASARERELALPILRARVQALGGLAEALRRDGQEQVAAVLEAALTLPGEQHVFLLGAEPVLTCWGFLPDVEPPMGLDLLALHGRGVVPPRAAGAPPLPPPQTRTTAMPSTPQATATPQPAAAEQLAGPPRTASLPPAPRSSAPQPAEAQRTAAPPTLAPPPATAQPPARQPPRPTPRPGPSAAAAPESFDVVFQADPGALEEGEPGEKATRLLPVLKLEAVPPPPTLPPESHRPPATALMPELRRDPSPPRPAAQPLRAPMASSARPAPPAPAAPPPRRARREIAAPIPTTPMLWSPEVPEPAPVPLPAPPSRGSRWVWPLLIGAVLVWVAGGLLLLALLFLS